MNDIFFISLNIVDNDNKCLNNSAIPIVYYWNSKDELLESMKSQEGFKDNISKLCFNEKLYPISKIKYIYIINPDIKEYKTGEVNIQDLFKLEEIEDDFYYKYVLDILKSLYTNVYKKEYDYNEDNIYVITPTSEEEIIDLYKSIIGGVKREITLKTVVTYIQKTLSENTKLSKDNIQFLIDKLTNIIKEKQ